MRLRTALFELPTQEGSCPRLRPALLSESACSDKDPIPRGGVPAGLRPPPTPPTCCENARRAEAAAKHVQDVLDGHALVRLFERSARETERVKNKAKERVKEEVKERAVGWLLAVFQPPPPAERQPRATAQVGSRPRRQRSEGAHFL
mmetsp:Transcript_156113/g.479112  ORF Transcript_156113/g.479112 Transcript_156113/m.479112 type:complete len:147 (+) Transcript_156113:101-541(+)